MVSGALGWEREKALENGKGEGGNMHGSRDKDQTPSRKGEICGAPHLIWG